MKIAVLWLCLLASVAQAHRAAKAETLQAVVNKATVQFGLKMSLGSSGVLMDDFVKFVMTHAPDIYGSYDDEHNLQKQISKILTAEQDISTKMIAGLKKYFRGEMLDLGDAVLATFNDSHLNTAMQQQHGGVTMNEIIAAFKARYPNIYRTYVYNEQVSEHGLRSLIGRTMSQTLPGKFFIEGIPNSSPFPSRKYFWGKKPNLSAVFAALFSLQKLLARMEWQAEGVSMDELVAQIKTARPKVYDYYVQATKEKEEWWLRHELYNVLAAKIEPLLAEKITKEKGAKPSIWTTEARVFAVTGVNKHGNTETKVFYGMPHDLDIVVESKFGQQRLQMWGYDDPEITPLQALLHDRLISKQVNFMPVLREAVSSLAAEMQWGTAGVSMDDVVAKVKQLAPDVYSLYRRAAHNNSEEGLRTDLVKALAKVFLALDPLKVERTFTLAVLSDAPEKQLTKYFLGKHPASRLAKILPELVDKLDASRVTAAGITKVMLGDYYDLKPSAASQIFRHTFKLPSRPIILKSRKDTEFLRNTVRLYRHASLDHERAFKLLRQDMSTWLEQGVEEGRLIVINPAVALQDRKYAAADK